MEFKNGDRVVHSYYGVGTICQWAENEWVGVVFENKELTRSGDGYNTTKREELKKI